MPAPRVPAWTTTLLLSLLLFAPLAMGQVFIDADDRSLELDRGETKTTTIGITNPTDRSYVVQATATGNLSEATEVHPQRFDVNAQEDRTVRVNITPPRDSSFHQGDLLVQFQFIDRETGGTLDRTVTLDLSLERPILYLNLIENPLPEPYDTRAGLFALELVTWAAAALLIALITRQATARATPLASEDAHAAMTKKLRGPIAALPIVIGLNLSWRLIPRSPLVEVTGLVLNALTVIVASLALYRVLSAGLVYYGERSSTDASETQGVLVPVLEKLSAATVFLLAGFFVLQALNVQLSFLVGGGLVAGLVISMAAQDTLSNFFSGLHILLDQPFREGNVIELDSGEVCRVERIGLRSTRLYHFQNHQEIIAPNNELASNLIVNMSYPDTIYRATVPVGVAYGTDLQRVTHLLHTIAMDTDEVIKGRTTKPKVFLREFGESSINLELLVFLPTERNRNPVRTKLIQRIHEAFEEEGITIPFPQRVLHIQPGAEEGDQADLPEGVEVGDDLVERLDEPEADPEDD